MGKLTTHILDTSTGKPASGVLIELYRRTPVLALLSTHRSNTDGRCDSPLLENNALTPGEYELVFHIGDYFRALGHEMSDPPFLDEIVLRFGIGQAQQNYHVPLLVSPWSYSTYRGS